MSDPAPPTPPGPRSSSSWTGDEQQVKAIVTAPWFIHDLILYAGTYLMLWAGDLPAGGGWDAAISAAPIALSALLRQLLGKTE